MIVQVGGEIAESDTVVRVAGIRAGQPRCSGDLVLGKVFGAAFLDGGRGWCGQDVERHHGRARQDPLIDLLKGLLDALPVAGVHFGCPGTEGFG